MCFVALHRLLLIFIPDPMGTAADDQDRPGVAALVAKFEGGGRSAVGLERMAVLDMKTRPGCADPKKDAPAGDETAKRVTFSSVPTYHEIYPESDEESLDEMPGVKLDEKSGVKLDEKSGEKPDKKLDEKLDERPDEKPVSGD